MCMDSVWDAIVVGGGPAGLSAALMLGRCRRRVLLVDDGRPRNAVSRASHGFFTRDGADPVELRRIGRAELVRYGVEVRDVRADDAEPAPHGFDVFIGGERQATRALVLATGLVDRVPDVPGFADFYGRGIWHCPYCDGWEQRDVPMAIYGRGREGVGFALGMQSWSHDIVLLTDGVRRLDARSRRDLEHAGIPVRSERIVRFAGDTALETIELAGGSVLERRALFFHLGVEQRSPLPAKLGCAFDRKGVVKTVNLGQESTVPWLWVVGDASEDALFVVVAAAEGTKAAVAIHKRLCHADRERRSAQAVAG